MSNPEMPPPTKVYTPDGKGGIDVQEMSSLLTQAMLDGDLRAFGTREHFMKPEAELAAEVAALEARMRAPDRLHQGLTAADYSKVLQFRFHKHYAVFSRIALGKAIQDAAHAGVPVSAAKANSTTAVMERLHGTAGTLPRDPTDLVRQVRAYARDHLLVYWEPIPEIMENCDWNDRTIKHHVDNLPSAACLACGKTTGTKRCTGCYRAYFCDRECQLKAWPAHKNDCRQ